MQCLKAIFFGGQCVYLFNHFMTTGIVALFDIIPQAVNLPYAFYIHNRPPLLDQIHFEIKIIASYVKTTTFAT